MKVLVLGAGGPAGANTCRALARAGHVVYGADDNPNATLVEASPWDGEDVDVIVPQPDSLVRDVARRPGVYPGKKFLPHPKTIDICQAKAEAAAIWHDVGMRGPAIPIPDPIPDHLHIAADQLGLPFWLRADRGAGANKAIKVDDLRSAYHWIRFWATRGVEVNWIAEPYLPGRDLAWSSIWYHGELVACFLRERLEYIYPHLSPEGLTGTPTVARIVIDPLASQQAAYAVRVIDPRPHGIFSVDLREDEDGAPRPTEINAGRSFTTMGLWSLYGLNFTSLAAKCAIEEPGGRFLDPLEEGLTLHRHIDRGWSFERALVPA